MNEAMQQLLSFVIVAVIFIWIYLKIRKQSLGEAIQDVRGMFKG